MSPLRTMSDGIGDSLQGEEEDAFYRMVTSFDMKDRKECYRVLGLKPGADLDEIKAAYKRLARIWHPDKYIGRRDPCLVFQHLNEAYSNLIKAAQVTDNGGYGCQSGLSRWLDERWDWRSHRERMNWEKSGRALVDRWEFARAGKDWWVLRYYLYKGEWNEEDLRYRTKGLFYAHGVELGKLDLNRSFLWWRFETGIAGFEIDALTGLARIYACDAGRLDNLTTRLLARFGPELEGAVDQSTAADAWIARKASEEEKEDSTDTTADTTRRESSGVSGSSRESTSASGESVGQGEAGGEAEGSDGEEGFFSCTEADDEFREVEQGSGVKKDTTRKGPPRRAPPRRKQSSVASDGGSGIRTDARFERPVECPSVSPVELVKNLEKEVDEMEPSVVEEEGTSPDGGFNVRVIGKDSQLEHAATYARPDDLGESPSDRPCPSPSLSSAEEWCIDGYSSAADVEKAEGVAEAAYQAQYDSPEVDRSTSVNPKYIAKMDYTAQSEQEMSLTKGELVRMKGGPVNGWALVRRYRGEVPHTWRWVPREILEPLMISGKSR